MRSPQPARRSYWLETTDETEYPPLAGDAAFDLVVIGGGITGLTTAYLLTTEGARVLLIESGHICEGTTGYTTAKVTAQHGLIYSKIWKTHGAERAQLYADAQMTGLRLIRSIVETEKIDCDLASIPSAIYTSEEKRVREFEEEATFASELGLPVSLRAPADLPFPVASAVFFDDQAQFHPRRYCLALADAITRRGGTIAEHTRAVDIEEDNSTCTVKLEGGEVTARAAVMATQTPFTMKGVFFARTEPMTSYVLAAPSDQLPEAMYISVDDPVRSIRPHRGKDGDVLLLGGGGHATGREDDTEEQYRALEKWASGLFAGFQPQWRWSAQDFMSADGVPYIGSIGKSSSHVFTATGFAKWGMTNGTAAARLIADEVAGRENPWHELFDPTRIKPLSSAATVLKQGLETVKSAAGDRVVSLDTRDPADLRPGQGAVLMVDGERLAVFRDDDGTMHAVSATCTHLGCIVEFNDAERTWDCPCHGSRFDVEGEVLSGPATEDLEPSEIGSEING
jgi:glycine/D-amino acid oxidase-like deaminating enzyme/nitrite reductase/ring-hydroxylating ferredoxin subunit